MLLQSLVCPRALVRSIKRAPRALREWCKSLRIWWTRRDSNPRPPRCERGRKFHKAWCCNHLRLLSRALDGQLGQPRHKRAALHPTQRADKSGTKIMARTCAEARLIRIRGNEIGAE